MPHESPDFETRVNELLDNRLAPEDDAWVESQAALSPEDKQWLAGQQLMLDGLELSEVPELSADFAEQCVALAMKSDEVRPTPRRQQASGTSRWRVAILAGTLCLVFGFVAAEPLWTWLRGGPLSEEIAENPAAVIQPEIEEIAPTPENPIVGVDVNKVDEIDRPVIEDDPSETPPSIDSVAENEEQQYEDLYEMFRDLRARIPPTDGEENLLALRPQWVDDMATGLRPVADSVGGALNAIRRNIPPTPKTDGDDKPQAWLIPSDASELT